MNSATMFKLLKAEDQRRMTNEPIVIGNWSMGYHNRNSFVEQLLNGETVHLHDGSTLFMVLDELETFRAGYNGERENEYEDSEWGAWGADGKSILVRHEAGGKPTFWKLDIYDDSWDNAYTDEWTFADVEEVDWRG